MKNKGSKTTILVKTKTRRLLKKVGKKDQTYDDIISAFLRNVDSKNFENEPQNEQ
ncbi:MAG: hypothetical protein ACPKPY_13245 [Nitrososphaeraceae archaeon]